MQANAFRDRLRLAGVLLAAAVVAAGPEVQAQEDSLFRSRGAGSSRPSLFGSDADAKPQVSVSLAPRDAKPGDAVTLSIKVEIPRDSYTYSTSKEFSGGTKIRVVESPGLAAVGNDFKADHAPQVVYEPLFKQNLEKYHGRVTWARGFKLLPDAKPDQVSVTVALDYQVCNNERCLPLKETYTATLSAVAEGQRTSPSALPQPKPQPGAFTHDERPSVLGKPGPAVVRATLLPDDAKPGDAVTLSVRLKLDPDWHTYSITQPPDQAATPTAIKVAAVKGLTSLDDSFAAGAAPEIMQVDEETLKYRQEVYHGEVTWTRRYRVETGASGPGYGLAGSIRYQTCTGSNCLPAKTVSFSLGSAPVKSEIAADTPPAPVESVGTAAADRPGSRGLVPFLITAVLAGFAALLTPCVFPMVPITVSYFLKQSEKEHHRPVSMALTYCAGIVGTFTLLGLLMAVVFGAAQLNVLANNPWLNLGIAGVLVFFGLNLLGMFEIRIPSRLLNWTSGKEGQEGAVGVLFMALTFTLVSFTCTFAFVGGLLVIAAGGSYLWPIVGMLAFSAAFSLPFFFLALFPSYLQKLPKSGGWMNRVKVTMGLIEAGAAFKFLSVADLAWNPVPMLFDYTLVMSSWMVISLCAGLYLLGVFRFPHDTPADSVSVPRFVVAGTFLGLAAYLAVGLFAAEKPTGRLWEQIASFAPPRFSAGNSDLGPVLEHDGLHYALDFGRALEVAIRENQPVFLDFTGVNCVNCRLMELRMAQPQLRQRLEKLIRVQLYTDNVPTITDEKLSESIVTKNRRLQETWFGDVTLPAYAVITPRKELLSTVKGLQDVGDFAAFLDRGLEAWRDRSTTASAARSSGNAAATADRR